jgi:putative molybdopterin biosynthesis protein
LPSDEAASRSPGGRTFVGATPLEEALRAFLDAVNPVALPAEDVPVEDAAGRVTAGVVFARLSSPHYHASAMDGYALRAADTYGASERTPLRVECVQVDTGDPLPDGCDAVVPLEDALRVEEGLIELRAAAHPWQDVRVQGEDITAGQVLFGENHRLGPTDIGVLLAAGVRRVRVRRRPRVTIIPTGDEVVSPFSAGGLPPPPGRVIETNGTVARLTLAGWGAEARLTPPVPDDPVRLAEALDGALRDSDLVLIGAGSSAGRDDCTARVIADRGRVLVHGVAVRPGKPVILGVALGGTGSGGAKPVIGLPGYPVSSALALELYVKPLIFAWLGQPLLQAETVSAHLGRTVPSPLGVDEFVRVKVGRVRDRYVAVPLPRGAGLLSALSQADGTIHVPSAREGVAAGEEVSVALTRPRHLVDRALMVSGSHDLLLDLLGSRLAAADPGLILSTGRVGSVGGLLALRDGFCHLAGAHLLDETTGDYNRPWVERLLPDREVRLLTLAWRQQGLMVAPGNPKGVTGLGDLARSDVVFINRQRGSGTRVLLDYLLRQATIDPDSVQGYRREEGSHLGVASAVASGAADAGMGIAAAAQALGLDFIPVAAERYDLIYLPEFEDDPRLARIRDVLAADGTFRRAAEALGGYDLRDTGRVQVVFGAGESQGVPDGGHARDAPGPETGREGGSGR